MRTYQDIEKDVKTVAEQTSQLAFMNKEQIYTVVSMLVALSDELNNFIHELDIKMAQAEADTVNEALGKKVSASYLTLLIKNRKAEFKADKEWAERQIDLLRDLRIAALAAQRSAEN